VARRLNKALHLDNVGFAGLEAHVNSFGEPPFKFAMKLGAVHWKKTESELVVAFPVEVTIQDGAADGLASLSVVVRATYGFREELTDDALEAIPHYLGIVGWMQVWPYIRAEIQDLSTKLGFPPLTLPVLLTGQTRHVPVRPAEDSIAADSIGTEEELPLPSG
jgi:hypothetical protein